jgi:excisionase family DNA binding protein
MAMPTSREWITYKEASEVAGGLSRTTLWKLISTGDVRAAKIGSRVLICKESLLSYLESRSYAEIVHK